MTINYTTLLGLTEPVTGTQSGTWGSDINTGLTDYVEAAIAGAQVISGSQTAVTLSVTTGSSSAPTTLSQAGSGATGSSQYQIIRCTGNPAGLLTITAPASDKTYVVINATSTSQSVKIVGAGPTTGVTIVSGERAFVAWNGSDFVKVGGAAGGTNTQVQYNNNGVFGGVSGATTNGTAITFSTTNLKLQGSSTGVSSFASANSGATDYTITFPAASTTIPVATQTLTFSGPTAARTITLPDANFTTARTDAAQTFTGTQTFSSDASVNGLTVGRGAGAVSTNTAVGASALTANTNGSSNTAVGYQSLYSNITGATNTAFGHRAGYYVTNSDNTLVGNDAGRTITTGAQNTALGSYVMNNSVGVTGSENVGIGRAVLSALTSGSYNIAIGNGALVSNTTASYNTAVGYQAGYANTTGYNLAFFGLQAGYSNTTGASGSFLGVNAGRSNTTGNYNTAVGDAALYSNTTASYSTAVGYQAGYSYNRTSDTDGVNLFAGARAGYSVTTGNYNTFVGGINSGYYLTTGSKNTILGNYTGNQGGLDIRTASNRIVLSDGDGNPRLYIDNNGYSYFSGATAFATGVGAGTNTMIGSTAGYFTLSVRQDQATNAYGVGISTAGGLAMYFYHAASGTPVGNVTTTASSTAYNTSSDIRLKIDKGVVTETDVIDKTVIHDFEWKVDGAPGRGVFAQEAYEVKPTAVFKGNDDLTENGELRHPWSVDYSVYVPDLIVYCQQLRKELDSVKTELATLKGN